VITTASKHPTEVQRLLRCASVTAGEVWSANDAAFATNEAVVLPPMPSLSISSQHKAKSVPLTALLSGYCSWQHSAKVPHYVRQHLWPEQADQLHITVDGDWCYRASLNEEQQQSALAWVQAEECWLPRLSGQCYTQGVVMEDNEIVLYAISDAYAAKRARHIERLYKFL
jgi:hypothetical protein